METEVLLHAASGDGESPQRQEKALWSHIF